MKYAIPLPRRPSKNSKDWIEKQNNESNGALLWLAAFRDESNQLVAHGLKIDRGSDQFDLGKHGQVFHQRFEQFLYTLP